MSRQNFNRAHLRLIQSAGCRAGEIIHLRGGLHFARPEPAQPKWHLFASVTLLCPGRQRHYFGVGFMELHTATPCLLGCVCLIVRHWSVERGFHAPTSHNHQFEFVSSIRDADTVVPRKHVRRSCELHNFLWIPRPELRTRARWTPLVFKRWSAKSQLTLKITSWKPVVSILSGEMIEWYATIQSCQREAWASVSSSFSEEFPTWVRCVKNPAACDSARFLWGTSGKCWMLRVILLHPCRPTAHKSRSATFSDAGKELSQWPRRPSDLKPSQKVLLVTIVTCNLEW